MSEHPSPWPPLTLDTPVGRLRLYADEHGALARIRTEHPARPFPAAQRGCHPAALDDAATQLAEYFLGRRHRFTVLVAPATGRFPRDAAAVWRRIIDIPYGEPVSAARCAPGLGTNTLRRLALILAANPLPIIVPTHRVIWPRDDEGTELVRPVGSLGAMLREHERQVIASGRPPRDHAISGMR